MKLSRFIKRTKEIIQERKFTVKENEEYERNLNLYNTLIEFDNKTTVEEFCNSMIKNRICPSEFSQSFICNKKECSCEVCWAEYMEKRLRPFQQLEFYKALHCDEKSQRNVEVVQSQEYIDWLYEYLKENKKINSENLLYDEDKVNSEYAKLLFIFLQYINDLVDETDLENLANHNEYESERYLIKIRDKYYDLCVIFGQGSIMFINELEEKPKEYLTIPDKRMAGD